MSDTKLNQVQLNVPDISCSCCVGNISKAIEKVDGVSQVDVNADTKTVSVSYAGTQTNEQQIRQAIEQAGYSVGV